MSPLGPLAVAASPSLWTGWFDDPIPTILLVVLLALYVDGFMRVRGGGTTLLRSGLRTGSFFAGFAVAGLTLLSPLDGLGYRLFAAHMAQHLLLIVVVAPLLAYSDAPSMWRAALPRSVRHGLAGGATRLAIPEWLIGARAAWLTAITFSVTIWFWHVPAAHDAALTYLPLHALEHVTVLLSAALFWRVILTRGKRGVGPGLTAVIVSLVSLQGSLLSAILMFAPAPLCASYASNPLNDQVMAGLLMCIPASFVYAGTTVWALTRMIGIGPRHVR